MGLLVAAAVSLLMAVAVYLMLRRHVVQVAFGFAIASNAVNLLILSAAGVLRSRPPVVAAGETTLAPASADPLPQAFILTAIVISFGIMAFLLVLLLVTYRKTGTEDADQWTAQEGIPDATPTQLAPEAKR